MLSLKLGIRNAEFAHVMFRANADIGIFFDEQPQLIGEVGLGFVVRRRGQQYHP